MATIRAIYRYPIKGLSPEPLARAALSPGETIPGDRLYAIENGPSGFDPAVPSYLAKTHFLMLMRNERLAALHTAFDQDTHVLTVNLPSPREAVGRVGEHRDSDVNRGGGNGGKERPTPDPSPPRALRAGGGEYVSGDLGTKEGRLAIEAFFRRYMPKELRGPPKVLHAEGKSFSFSDVAKKVVSIINLASVKALADTIGAPVDPLRFRGNVYVDGWPAWSELDLVGEELAINPPGGRGGDTPVRLKVVKRIVRCAATNVDPATGARDLNIPQTLMRTLGHADCGIYAEVIEGGEMTAGGTIEMV